ncbi:hypothetical protein N0V83_004365 [Neocucurbitaria cava]|uniref:Uncharacterized protein n=1 Tax=Neocucurbitaria cava TaxID=798079 RepID=A0A9W8Y9L9_9PLEO|nr:hypothetical protein N0V83_004365 [Neocucurbitaria cava]
MSKRSADSPLQKEGASKKQKVVGDAHVSESAPVALASNATVVGQQNSISPEHQERVSPDSDEAPAIEVGASLQAEAKPTDTKKAGKKPKNPPVKEAFTAWTPTVQIPPHNQFWGIKPLPGGPRPHPTQPSARDSDAATNPPMWEDRKYRFKRGSRYVQFFGPIAPSNADVLPENLDQEDLLLIQLIDMRPVSSKDPTPRRMPTTYHYEQGKPKDWDSMQAVKCLNDRRAQAIDRITLDAPWTRVEREYLASLLQESPDASIWELTERHNERFMDRDFAHSIGFGFTDLSTGRTVESVSHEYKTFKSIYDQGRAPDGTRYRNDNSREGKALRAEKVMEKAFGPPNKALEKEWDAQNGSDNGADGGSDDEANNNEAANNTAKPSPKKKGTKPTARVAPKGNIVKPAQKAPPKKPTTKKKSESRVVHFEDDNNPQGEPIIPMAEQPKLGDLDEELLELAGANHPDEVRHSPPRSLPPDSPEAGSPVAWVRPGSRSPGPHAGEQGPHVDAAATEAVKQIVGEIVDKAVAYAEEQKAIDENEETTVEKVSIAETAVVEVTTAENVPVQSVTQTITTAVEQRVVSDAVQRRTSIHAARRIEVDEEYDDDTDVDEDLF